MNSLFKVIASLCLAIAYVGRLRERALSELDAGSSAFVGQAENGNSPNIEEDVQNGKEDGDDGDEPKKKRLYDWPSVILRMRRILPMSFPRHSRLAYLLIGKLRAVLNLVKLAE